MRLSHSQASGTDHGLGKYMANKQASGYRLGSNHSSLLTHGKATSLHQTSLPSSAWGHVCGLFCFVLF